MTDEYVIVWAEHASGVREVFDAHAYRAGRPNARVTTCGACGRSWDDAHVSVATPAPSGRCPFECEHRAVKDWDTREPAEDEPCAVCGREDRPLARDPKDPAQFLCDRHAAE